MSASCRSIRRLREAAQLFLSICAVHHSLSPRFLPYPPFLTVRISPPPRLHPKSAVVCAPHQPPPLDAVVSDRNRTKRGAKANYPPEKPSTMSSSSAVIGSQSSPALKTLFKTPEGRYKLLHEKTFPAAALHYIHGKPTSQLTLAYLKDKPPASQGQAASSASSSAVRLAAAKLLGTGNGSRSGNLIGGNGFGRVVSANYKMGAPAGAPVGSSAHNVLPNYDGKGTYLIFNVADTLFISDLNSTEKDPIKSIQFSNSNPVCHAFDAEAKDGHDLLIGLQSGDVYLVSLRQQLQDTGRKIMAAYHYNKDGSINNSRCTCMAWVSEREGTFVVGHADGNIYVYEKNKDGSGDSLFPAMKDQTQFSVMHSRSSKSNPVARWHVCQGSINSISFSADGAYMATVARDGYLRVFDFSKEQLAFGGKSYYGALLCSTWSSDGKYILTGGEDDLVQVWSVEDRKTVAWGEGHNSWISGVAFDSYWSVPNSEGTEESVVYRFGSVGQDAQLLLWDLVMDELIVPQRGPPGASPTFSNGAHSANWDPICPMGLLPAPSMRDVPKISPLVAHRAHIDPLSGLIFTKESVITIARDGHIKIWARPGHEESSQSDSSKPVITTAILKDGPAAAIR